MTRSTLLLTVLGVAAVLAAAIPAPPGVAGAEDARPARPRAAVLLFPGVQIIDYTGPYEVLGQGGFDVHTVALRAEPLETAMGMTVTPAYTLADAPPADVLVVPGGNVEAALRSEATLAWVRTRSKEARYTLSVCNGAFVLARAGLLDGLAATTFYNLLDELERAAPRTRVVRDQRFVDNGRIITAAGLSSGIDGALHVIERMKGRGSAQQVALHIEYNWRPDSGWARAALADQVLPRLRTVGVTVAGVVATEGDRDRWRREVRLESALSLEEVRRRVARLFTESGWTPGATAGAWIRRDTQGRDWRASAVVEPASAPGEFAASFVVDRAG